MTDAPNLFDGPAYEPEFDNDRLTMQIGRVYATMRDGRWRTLQQIADVCSALRDDAGTDPHASISAQLRHLRKPRWGGHTINRRAVEDSPGLFEYQLEPSGLGLLNGRRDVVAEPNAQVPCPTCGGRGTVTPHDYGEEPAP